ncbi:MAG: ATP synthase F1 subunit gamma [Alphaproteobacteria bacterium]|nr:ATP synthase F1 subunit gamma [Alphaproteobacteria bacterium]
MAGLKELRGRIAAIKSTEKITSAMKMVAASRLRRAQDILIKSEKYRSSIYDTISRIKIAMQKESSDQIELKPTFLCQEKEKQERYLLVVLTSDKGLCGSYNNSIGKVALNRLHELLSQGKDVKVITLGRRGYNIFRRHNQQYIFRNDESVVNKGVEYSEAIALAEEITSMFKKDEIDVCEVVYSRFKSALSRDVKSEQILPFDLKKVMTDATDMHNDSGYDFEPGYDALLETLVPMAFREYIFDIMINSQASEQGARMASMDNATRNAGDMINKLTMRYNRLRQGAITTELTEIIAGAEAI